MVLVLAQSLSIAQTGQYVPPQTSPMPRPPVSPYLNLNRGGSPGVNYFGLVRPQENMTTAIQQLQQQQAALATSPAAPSASLGFITGHPATFVNYSHYYYNSPAGRGVYGPLRSGVAGPYAGAPFPYGGAGLPYAGLGWGSYPGLLGYPGSAYPGVGYPGIGYPGIGYPGMGYPGVGAPYPVPGAGNYQFGIFVP
jgi:hypothetical protein